ncbi:MAG: hypothetical protein AAF696_26140, partial [Bacteroidota bacterium]
EKLVLELGKLQQPSKRASTSEGFMLKELFEKIQEDEDWNSQGRLQVYIRMYKLLKGDEGESLYEILKLMQRTESLWERDELANLLMSLINFSIRGLNQTGSPQRAQELFLLFEWGIESRLFFIDQNLPEIIYKNLIDICLRIENYQKASKYLESLKNLLPEARREECYRFNLGRYHFERKAYKEVISCFIGHRFTNLVDEIDARTFLLQSQYELASEEPDWIARQLNTLARFVKNQELSPQFKLAMKNGLRLFRKLVLAYTAFEYEQLLTQIEKTRPLYRAQWLAKKTKEHIKKRPESNPTS